MTVCGRPVSGHSGLVSSRCDEAPFSSLFVCWALNRLRTMASRLRNRSCKTEYDVMFDTPTTGILPASRPHVNRGPPNLSTSWYSLVARKTDVNRCEYGGAMYIMTLPLVKRPRAQSLMGSCLGRALTETTVRRGETSPKSSPRNAIAVEGGSIDCGPALAISLFRSANPPAVFEHRKSGDRLGLLLRSHEGRQAVPETDD